MQDHEPSNFVILDWTRVSKSPATWYQLPGMLIAFWNGVVSWYVAPQGIFGRTMFTAMHTCVTLTANMLTLNVFKHSPLVLYNVITVSTSPKQASISSHFLQHLHLNDGWKSGLERVFQTVLSVNMGPEGISCSAKLLTILAKVPRGLDMFWLAVLKQGSPELCLMTTVCTSPHNSRIGDLFQHFCLHCSCRERE